MDSFKTYSHARAQALYDKYFFDDRKNINTVEDIEAFLVEHLEEYDKDVLDFIFKFMTEDRRNIERVMHPEIIPYSLPENLEIGIEKMSITYVQKDDTNHAKDEFSDQFITISTEAAICNREEALKKQGYYYTIKTNRWAIEDEREIAALIKDFRDRLMLGVDELNRRDGVKMEKKKNA